MQKDEILFSQVDMLSFYDQVLVPAIFSPWSELLLEQVDSAPDARVLDIATGPGTVIRTALKKYHGRVSVIGADISPAMLDIARRNIPSVEFVESPAADLDFPSNFFDLVTCQQGFQYFPDKVAAMQEVRRVLRPEGQFALAVWGPITGAPQFQIYKQAMTEAGALGEALKVVEVPFSWPHLSEFKDLVRSCELKIEKATTLVSNSVYKGSVDQLIAAAKAAPFGPHLTALSQKAQGIFDEAVARLSEKYREKDKFVFPMECNIIVGNK